MKRFGPFWLALLGLAGTLVFAGLWWRAARAARDVTAPAALPAVTEGPEERTAPTEPGAERAEARRWRAEALRLRDLLAARDGGGSGTVTGGLSHLPPETQRRLVAALLAADLGQRVRELKQMGLAPRSEDFRAMAMGVTNDWRAHAELAQLLPAWLEVDAAEAAAWVASLPAGPKLDQAVSLLVNHWARKDPEAALAWILSLPAGRVRDNALGQYVGVGAAQRPREMSELCLKIENENNRMMAVRNVAMQWMRQDADAAARWIESLPAGRLRDAGMESAVTMLAQKDPERAVRWLESLSAEQTRLAFLPNVLNAWVRKDSAAVSRWLQTLSSGRWRDAAVQQFCMYLAGTQPVTALDWALTIEDVSQREAAVAHVVGQWARVDPAAASEWLTGLTAGRSRDLAVQQFALQLAQTMPALAAEWAGSIGAEDVRMATLGAVAGTWLQVNRAEAVEWLSSSPLPESTRAALLQKAGARATQ